MAWIFATSEPAVEETVIEANGTYIFAHSDQGDVAVLNGERQSFVEVFTLATGNSGGVDASKFVIGERPTGIIDGINATFFTLQDFVPGTLEVFNNGISQIPGEEFSTAGVRLFQFIIHAPETGDNVTVNYIKP